MKATEDQIFKELEEILEKNKDAVKGFRKATENTHNITLKTYFTKKAADRDQFNNDLLAKMKTLYTNRDIDGSFAGTIHRAWMDVKALFSADDAESMLEESIRGDKAAIEEYNDVIKYEVLPAGLRDLVITQRDAIMHDIAKNKTLEDLH